MVSLHKNAGTQSAIVWLVKTATLRVICLLCSGLAYKYWIDLVSLALNLVGYLFALFLIGVQVLFGSGIPGFQTERSTGCKDCK